MFNFSKDTLKKTESNDSEVFIDQPSLDNALNDNSKPREQKEKLLEPSQAKVVPSFKPTEEKAKVSTPNQDKVISSVKPKEQKVKLPEPGIGQELPDVELNEDGTLKIIPPKEEIKPSLTVKAENSSSLTKLKDVVNIETVTLNEKRKDIRYSDFDINLPECSERSIFFILKCLEELDQKESSFSSFLVLGQIKKEFDLLKSCLKKEGQESLIYNKLFLTTVDCITQKKYKEAAENFGTFLKEYQPLNIQKLLTLIEKEKNTGEKIKGEDIIILLGTTGAGKSTLMHYLCKSIMGRLTTKDDYPIEYIGPIEIKNPALEKDIICNPLPRSETKQITAVQLNLEEYGLKEKKIFVCDTPGFDDTEDDIDGPVRDVANVVGINNALHNARSVKPLILFSTKSGDQLEGMKKTAKIISKMVREYEKYSEAFSYVLTKCENTIEKNNFVNKVKKYPLNVTDRSDKAFKLLLSDLSDHEKMKVVNLLEEDPDALRNGFMDELINGKEPIPGSAFSSVITEDSKKAVRLQVEKHLLRIKFALENENYELVEYKLNELKELAEILQDKEIQHKYDQCKNDVFEKLKKVLQQNSDALVYKITKGKRFLEEKDIIEYKKKITVLKIFEKFPGLAKSFNEKDLTSNSNDFIKQQAEYYLQMSKETNSNLSNFKLKDGLDNLLMLANAFEDIKEVYNIAKGPLDVYLNEAYSSAMIEISKLDFTKAQNHIKKILEIRKVFSKHITEDRVKPLLTGLGQKVESQVQQKLDIEMAPLFLVEKWTDDHCLAVDSYIKTLSTVKQLLLLKGFISNEKINDIEKNLTNKINLKYETLIQELNKDLIQDSLNESIIWINAGKYIKQLNFLKISEFENRKTKIVEVVCLALKKVKEKIDEKIHEGKYSELEQLIVNLKKAKWIADPKYYKSTFYANLLADVESKLLLHVKQLDGIIEGLSYDLTKVDLDHINELNMKILNLQKIVTEGTAKSFEELSKKFEKKKTIIGKEIIKYFDLEKQSTKIDEIELNKLIKLKEEYYSFDPLLVLKNVNIAGVNNIEKLKLKIELYKADIDKVKGHYNTEIVIEKSKLLELERANERNMDAEKDQGFIFNTLNKIKKYVATQYDEKYIEINEKIKIFQKTSQQQVDKLTNGLITLTNLEKKYNANSIQQKIILEPTEYSTIEALSKKIIDTTNHILYRQDSGYYPLFKDLNVETIEKLLKYTGLFAESSSITAMIKSCLKQYEYFVKKDIKMLFLAIIKQEGKEDSIEMERKVEILADRMKNLERWVTKHSAVFKLFQENILEKSIELFEEKFVFLSMQIEKLKDTKNIFLLQVKLNAVTQLKILDPYLKENSFALLASQCNEAFQKLLMSVTKEIQDDIESYAFEKLSESLIKLKNTKKDNYIHIYNGLHLKLKQLFIDTNRCLNNMQDFICESDNEKLPNLLQNLKYIVNANNFLWENLENEHQKQFDDSLKNIDEKITIKLLKAKTDVDNLLKDYCFVEAQRKIDILIKNTNLLEDSCDNDLKNEIFELQEKWEKAIQAMIFKYKNAEIESYSTLKPSDIVKNLTMLGRSTIELEQYFLDEFISKLDELEKNTKNISQWEKTLNKFSSLINCFPESSKEKIIHIISEFQLEIKKKKDRLQEKLQGMVKINGNAAEIKKIMEDENFLNDTTINGIVLKLNEYGNDIINILNMYIEKKDINKEEIVDVLENTVCVKLKELLDYAHNFKEVSEIDQLYKSNFEKTKKIVDGLYDSIIDFVNNVESAPASMIPRVESSFDVIKYFYIVLKETDKVKTPLLEYLGNKVSIIFNIIKKNNHTYFENVKSALTINDVDAVEKNFINSKDLDCLINKCSEFDDKKELKLSSELGNLILKDVQSLKEYIENVDLINGKTKQSLKERLEYYEDLKNKIDNLVIRENLKDLFEDEDDHGDFENKTWCIKILKSKILNLSEEATKLINNISKDELLAENLITLNHLCNHLKSLQVAFVPDFFKKDIINIERKEEEILKFVYQALVVMEENIKNPAKFAKELIKIKLISNKIAFVKDKVNDKINLQVDLFKKTNDTNKLEEITIYLQEDSKGTGAQILNEHFDGMATYAFNIDTKKRDYKDVLKNIETDLDTKNLGDKYDEFFKIYWNELVKKYLAKGKKDMSLQPLVEAIKCEAKMIINSQKTKVFVWNEETKNKLPRLIAHIFALWTLKNADKYFEMEGSEDRFNYLKQPHAVQVIAIFCAFAIGDNDNKRKKEVMAKLLSHLVKLDTGNGKSVTLAVMSMVFALLEHDVMCACYSEHLSNRDFNDFKDLFEILGLINKEDPRITYGPFNKLCEEVINKPDDIRSLVKQTVLAEKIELDKKPINKIAARPIILLLDEVDMFFSVYGKLFRPSATLQDKKITTLIEHIWCEAKKHGFSDDIRTLKNIKDSDAYKKCCPLFKKEWEFILEDAVTQMILVVLNLKTHEYVCKDKKIGYKDQDGISYKITKGYYTLFAALHEFENANVSPETLEELMGISVNCGNFSYDKALTKFQTIMGFSGTLKTLSQFELKVLKELGIFKFSFMPSAFGENKLKFDPEKNVTVVDQDNYYQRITQSIHEAVKNKRPVLVFFETEKELDEFYNSDVFAEYRDKTQKMTAKLNQEEREYGIKQAMEPEQITLLTSEYRRGTDFKGYNKEVNDAGGAHIVQIGFAESLAEEIQTRGRGARNGKEGSYEIIIPEKNLEKFIKNSVINITEFKGSKDAYKILNDLRNKSFDSSYIKKADQFELVKTEDEKTQKFLIHIREKNTESFKFLKEINPPAKLKKVTNIFCLLDATGSMHSLIDNTKNGMLYMFERSAGIAKGAFFQFKVGIFRNYEDKKEIYEESCWASKPSELDEFMKNARAKGGGCGGEAGEIGLFHANKINKKDGIREILMFGDAPPNKKTGSNSVSTKRAILGEEKWKEMGYVKPTHYKIEAKELSDSKVPVSTFYLDSCAEKKFEKIAKLTGGDCHSLKINSDNAAELLAGIFSKKALKLVGGDEMGEKYVKEYESLYESSYRK